MRFHIEKYRYHLVKILTYFYKKIIFNKRLLFLVNLFKIWHWCPSQILGQILEIVSSLIFSLPSFEHRCQASLCDPKV